jgi:hypothetical protein
VSTAALADIPVRVRVSAEPIKGEIINAATRLPVSHAVVNASWTIEPVNEDPSVAERRLTIQQVTTDDSGEFVIPGWSTGRRIPDGWRIKPGFDPKITVFANGFYHGEFENQKPGKDGKKAVVNKTHAKVLRSVWDKDKLLLQPFSEYSGQRLYAGPQWGGELSTWLYAIRTETAAYEWKDKKHASLSQMRLFDLLNENCKVIREIESDSVCNQLNTYSSKNNLQATPNQNPHEQNNSLFYQPENGKPVKLETQKPGISVQEIPPR